MPNDCRVLVGERHPGDPDLALHYAVARVAGVAILGAATVAVIGPVDRPVILGVEQGSAAYAVVNAPRALRFAVDGTLYSKVDGGEWALRHGEPDRPIEGASRDQRAGTISVFTPDQASWVGPQRRDPSWGRRLAPIVNGDASACKAWSIQMVIA